MIALSNHLFNDSEYGGEYLLFVCDAFTPELCGTKTNNHRTEANKLSAKTYYKIFNLIVSHSRKKSLRKGI